MCVAVLLTAIPMSAFAIDAEGNYCEIKIKKGCKDTIEPGETTEIYVDYYVESNQQIDIVWSTPGNMCEYEYVTDSETGLTTGMKITSVSGGTFYAFVQIIGSDGEELASDCIGIFSRVPDNRPLSEKADEFFEQLPGNIFLFNYVISYIVFGILLSPISAIGAIFYRIKDVLL